MESELASSHEIPPGSLISAMKDVRSIADRTFSHHWQGSCIPTWHEVITKLNDAMGTRRRI